jgi:hypothetical protein
MNNLSREQVIAILSLAFAILGTLAAAFAVQNKLTRFTLIVFTLALAFASGTYLYTSLYNEKSLKELSKEEMIQEAKRQLKEEQTSRDEVFKQARERLERERIEHEAAEKAAKEANKKDEIEREAHEAIIREDAVKKLRERMEAEKAEKARQVAEALIIGKWNGIDWWTVKRIEFDKNGKFYNSGFVYDYRVVDATNLDIKTLFGNSRIKFKVSGDKLYYSGATFNRAK